MKGGKGVKTRKREGGCNSGEGGKEGKPLRK